MGKPKIDPFQDKDLFHITLCSFLLNILLKHFSNKSYCLSTSQINQKKRTHLSWVLYLSYINITTETGFKNVKIDYFQLRFSQNSKTAYEQILWGLHNQHLIYNYKKIKSSEIFQIQVTMRTKLPHRNRVYIKTAFLKAFTVKSGKGW